MLQMSHCLRSLGDIESCIRLFAASYVPGKQSILISIYTHWNKPETIREMTRLFCAAFPEAEIAGMTTAGGIDHGRMRLRQTVVTIQFFEKSDVHTAIYDFSQEPMGELGKKARSFCQRQKDLSALLLLMTQRYYDFEPFLTALDKLGKDIPICGGYAHIYRNEDGIYVFTKDAILSCGILLVTFSGDVKVMTTSVMGWQPLGRTMTITAIDGPLVIRSLDHKPAAYFYQKYLHSTDFGKSELLVPLVRSRHQVQLSVLPLEHHAVRMPEKGKRAVLLVSPLGHNAARQHADTLTVAVRNINPHAARCHNRIQRHFGIKIVVAPHTADRHSREHTLDLPGILGVIA